MDQMKGTNFFKREESLLAVPVSDTWLRNLLLPEPGLGYFQAVLQDLNFNPSVLRDFVGCYSGSYSGIL